MIMSILKTKKLLNVYSLCEKKILLESELCLMPEKLSEPFFVWLFKKESEEVVLMMVAKQMNEKIFFPNGKYFLLYPRSPKCFFLARDYRWKYLLEGFIWETNIINVYSDGKIKEIEANYLKMTVLEKIKKENNLLFIINQKDPIRVFCDYFLKSSLFVIGLASLTKIFLPSSSLWSNISLAFSASSSVDISTNPKPFDLFENLSIITAAETTDPAGANVSLSISLVTE